MTHDLEVKIEFEPDLVSASNVLAALTSTVQSFEQIDDYICRAFQGPTFHSLRIERVETGSIRLFLRTLLEGIDDDQLRDKGLLAAWREALVAAKTLAIRFLSEDGYSKAQLQNDAIELLSPVRGPLIDSVPDDFVPIITNQARKLAIAARQIEGPATILLIQDHSQAHIVPSEDFEERLGQPDPAIVPGTERVSSRWRLIIKKPDMLGRSQWEFRLGRRPILAPIRDGDWLSRFHAGEILLRPGDVMTCVAETTLYKENGLVVDEKHEILQVIDIKHTPPEAVQDLLIE